jgi:hypothetical protein
MLNSLLAAAYYWMLFALVVAVQGGIAFINRHALAIWIIFVALIVRVYRKKEI